MAKIIPLTISKQSHETADATSNNRESTPQKQIKKAN